MSSGEEPLYTSEPGAPAPPPKKRMSRAVKVVLLLLAGGALCSILCCGFLGINASRLIDAGKESERRSPEDAQVLAQDIVPLETPERFTPLVALDAQMFPAGKVSVAGYNIGDGGGAMWLIRLPVSVGNSGALFQSVREQLSQPGNAAGDRILRDLSIERTETRPMTVRGYDATVRSSLGTDRRTGERIRELTVAFPGRPGTTFLIVQVAEDDWNEDELVRVLESIR